MTAPPRGTMAALVVTLALMAGCSSSHKTAAAPSPSASPSAVPQAIWQGEAVAWSGAHSRDLKAISTAAGNVAKAAKAGNIALVQLGVTQFLLDVGRANASLPDNEFGRDMKAVMLGYANALQHLRTSVSTHDDPLFKKAAAELSRAVDAFTAISKRMALPP